MNSADLLLVSCRFVHPVAADAAESAGFECWWLAGLVGSSPDAVQPVVITEEGSRFIPHGGSPTELVHLDREYAMVVSSVPERLVGWAQHSFARVESYNMSLWRSFKARARNNGHSKLDNYALPDGMRLLASAHDYVTARLTNPGIFNWLTGRWL